MTDVCSIRNKTYTSHLHAVQGTFSDFNDLNHTFVGEDSGQLERWGDFAGNSF